MHVHVQADEGEAKFWLEPRIELARNHGLSATALKEVQQMIEERSDEIGNAWRRHFGG